MGKNTEQTTADRENLIPIVAEKVEKSMKVLGFPTATYTIEEINRAFRLNLTDSEKRQVEDLLS